jgi:hypothetical protein
LAAAHTNMDDSCVALQSATPGGLISVDISGVFSSSHPHRSSKRRDFAFIFMGTLGAIAFALRLSRD